MKNAQIPYNYLSNFVLRTPLLSFDFYKTLTANQDISKDELKKVYKDPMIREACFLASPTLYFEMEKWVMDELDPKKERKIKLSFLKYLTRLSTRCTPFGLFAGCSLGKFAEQTSIENSSPNLNGRHTRLDMNYLVALSQDISRKEGIREKLMFYPNSSIYRIGTQLRYIEYTYKNSRRHHHIIEVDDSEYLQKVLSKSKPGAHLKSLVKLLVEEDIPRMDAENFIEDLVNSQLLVSELEPSVSGPEFMSHIIQVLSKYEGTKNKIEFLKRVNWQLKNLDKQIGNNPKIYLSLSDYLKECSTAFELKFLFQTDLKLQPKSNKLSSEVAEAIKKGMVLLNKITPNPEENNLSKFKEAFLERYEEREMPLSKVLDVETGIGYLQDKGSGDVNPLIDNLNLPTKEDPHEQTTFTQNKFQSLLEEKLICSYNNQSQKIILTDQDFVNLIPNWDDIPDTLSTMVEVVPEGNKTKILFSQVGGSSAGNLLGRFCHGDEVLKAFTQKIAHLENQMNPGRILAEIVHLPESRVGNILMRPSFRDYEIPYLAKSSLDPENQIPLEDLFISIRNNRIVLRSRKINKEVIPHLTNAHDFAINALPIYHFICDMQTQNLRRGLYFSFGPIANHRRFLPRVEYDNLILSRAKWKIKKEEIEELLKNFEMVSELQKAVTKWRDCIKLPVYALLADGDNELLVNFNNVASVHMLLETVRNRDEFLLTEFLFDQTNAIVTSANGIYTNQIIVSLYNEKKLRNHIPE
ncbi:lantibiotic dehydratase family protein [Flagellimonas sp. S174]|uniref:lantibiotic dehydratase family protein n=1 Tax=Flagellimonas sp. S174 TaxID=3410790 RepID=UPI003BF4F228